MTNFCNFLGWHPWHPLLPTMYSMWAEAWEPLQLRHLTCPFAAPRMFVSTFELHDPLMPWDLQDLEMWKILPSLKHPDTNIFSPWTSMVGKGHVRFWWPKALFFRGLLLLVSGSIQLKPSTCYTLDVRQFKRNICCWKWNRKASKLIRRVFSGRRIRSRHVSLGPRYAARSRAWDGRPLWGWYPLEDLTTGWRDMVDGWLMGTILHELVLWQISKYQVVEGLHWYDYPI